MNKKSILLIALLLVPFLAFIPVSTVEATEPGAGQQVINYFIDLFNDDWNSATVFDSSIHGMGYAQNTTATGSPTYVPFPKLDLVDEEMEIYPILSPTSSYDGIRWLLSIANESLHLQQMYIYPSLDDILLDLIAAKNRGVNVTIVRNDGTEEHNNASGDILFKHGIESRILKGAPFGTQHNKGIIVDGEFVLVCSINFSNNSITNNREAGVIIRSTAVANYYLEVYNYDWDRSDAYVANDPDPDDPTPGSHVPNFTEPSYSGLMNVTCGLSPDNAFGVLMDVINAAENSIDVSVYTLSSSFIMQALLNKMGEGVKVRLLLSHNHPFSSGSVEYNYNRWTLTNFTEIGNNSNFAEGRLSSNVFTYQHCKYAIIDNATFIISSGNWAQTSCPKPNHLGNVNGNRDWWFVIYGDGVYVPSGLDLDEIPWWVIVIIAVVALGALFIYQRVTKKKATGTRRRR